MSDITLRAVQQYIREKDHQPDLKLQYLQKLVEEVGELAKAMRLKEPVSTAKYGQTAQLARLEDGRKSGGSV